jgi:DNA-directed RNA polymerase specialized sigma24 family protein
MTDPDKQEPEAAELVRPYVITNGRGLPGEDQFSLITLVTAAADHQQRPTRLSPEEQNLLEMCVGGYLSVAEIAGHTQLPLGVVKILLAALSEGGYLITRPPVTRAPLATMEILEEVLNGLRTKFG